MTEHANPTIHFAGTLDYFYPLNMKWRYDTEMIGVMQDTLQDWNSFDIIMSNNCFGSNYVSRNLTMTLMAGRRQVSRIVLFQDFVNYGLSGFMFVG